MTARMPRPPLSTGTLVLLFSYRYTLTTQVVTRPPQPIAMRLSGMAMARSGPASSSTDTRFIRGEASEKVALATFHAQSPSQLGHNATDFPQELSVYHRPLPFDTGKYTTLHVDEGELPKKRDTIHVLLAACRPPTTRMTTSETDTRKDFITDAVRIIIATAFMNKVTKRPRSNAAGRRALGATSTWSRTRGGTNRKAKIEETKNSARKLATRSYHLRGNQKHTGPSTANSSYSFCAGQRAQLLRYPLSPSRLPRGPAKMTRDYTEEVTTYVRDRAETIVGKQPAGAQGQTRHSATLYKPVAPRATLRRRRRASTTYMNVTMNLAKGCDTTMRPQRMSKFSITNATEAERHLGNWAMSLKPVANTIVGPRMIGIAIMMNITMSIVTSGRALAAPPQR